MAAVSSLTFQPLAISNKQSTISTLHSSNRWSFIIRRHAKLKDDAAILSAYSQLEGEGILPDVSICPIILKACARLRAVEKGRKIHSDISDSDLLKDRRVQTALVDFYCKCECLQDALRVFDEMTERDVVSWNAMISGFVKLHLYHDVIAMVRQMQMEDVKPSSVTAVALLLACGELRELKIGKEIHGRCLRNGIFDSNSHVGSALIGFYLKFGPNPARHVFDTMGMESRNVVCWNSMLTAYSDCYDYPKVIDLFIHMMADGINPDLVTVLIVVQACAEIGSLEFGEQVHALAIKHKFIHDSFLINALVNLYGNNGRFDSSCFLFNSTSIKDTALWNSILSVHINTSHLHEAMELFNRMRFQGLNETDTTLSILLPNVRNLKLGQTLHALLIKNGFDSIGNTLITMYKEMNRPDDAMKVFKDLSSPDLLSWNLTIMALAQTGGRNQAFHVFNQMKQINIIPNSHTMIALLAACDSESDHSLRTGKSIHGFLIRNSIEMNSSLNSSLTEMYTNCKDYSTGRYLFETYHDRDVISWNSFISICIKNDLTDQVTELLHRMILESEPNHVTLLTLLSSCINTGNLLHGRSLHAYAIRFSFGFDLSLSNAFMAMYARCGKLEHAENVFDTMPHRNVVSWNTIIDGYGIHGRGLEALMAFSEMIKSGFEPNPITFVSVLSACSHSGLLNEGLHLFSVMNRDFLIEPELPHYGCIVDLLGRLGLINEALKFINSMPIDPDASIWRALLSACRARLDTRLAETLFQRLVELEPRNGGNYVLMSNIYAAAGLWSEVGKVRSIMVENGLCKPTGKSWIAVKDEIHCFRAGDKSHSQSDLIYRNLRFLLSEIKEMEDVPVPMFLHQMSGAGNDDEDEDEDEY